MFSIKKTIVAIIAVALAPPSLASPLASPANASASQVLKWLNFYNDNACKHGGGKSMDISNPHCLTEIGRKSIFFHGSSQPRGYHVVVSPDDSCGCQQECVKVPGWPTGDCWDISAWKWAQSFRFQREVCAENNC